MFSNFRVEIEWVLKMATVILLNLSIFSNWNFRVEIKELLISDVLRFTDVTRRTSSLIKMLSTDKPLLKA